MFKSRAEKYKIFLKSCQVEQKSKQKTVGDIIDLGYKTMRAAKIHHHYFANYSLLETARYLVFFILQLPYNYLYKYSDQNSKYNSQYDSLKINYQQAKKILALFEQRISARLPVEYITNESKYLNFNFFVDKNVLVPRSLMNTRFKDFLNLVNWKNYKVLDLCTGSGCIGISLALLEPKLNIDLLDSSEQALKIAEINVKKHKIEKRSKCIQSNLFKNISNQKYDLIISNPPYVSTKDYNRAPQEFKNEPKLALECSKNGLDLITQIIEQAKNYLNPNGMLILEVGTAAPKYLKKKYPKINFTWYKYRHPSGKTSWFGLPCVFSCNAEDL